MSISKLVHFLKNDGGAITPFIVVMFLTMVVGGGMGVDFMRHEAERAALQGALDRRALAAASYDVADYEASADVEIDLEQRAISYVSSSDTYKSS